MSAIHDDDQPGFEAIDTTLEVAVLEDDPADARLFGRLLHRAWPGSVRVSVFPLVEELRSGLTVLRPDVIFSDLSVPDGHGIEVVGRVVDCAGAAPVVVLTGNGDPTAPVLALQTGAQDYLVKESLDVETLARSLRHSIARGMADGKTREIVRDLTAMNEERSQYADIVAHDLRAPVRTARLSADRLVAAIENHSDPRAVATALDGSLGRIEAIIDGLLGMAGLRDDSLAVVDERLGHVVGDIEADLLADITALDATVVCQSDDSIRADPVLIRELLRNLVQNSLKYRDPGRAPVVEIEARRLGHDLEVLVIDNGIGIEPRHRDQVFRPFERLDGSPTPQGLGLGLAFCRRVVELHRGTIEIADTARTSGTCVRIVIPTRRS